MKPIKAFVAWLRVLTGRAQQAQRMELLHAMRADDEIHGRDVDPMDTLIRKYERRKPFARMTGLESIVTRGHDDAE